VHRYLLAEVFGVNARLRQQLFYNRLLLFQLFALVDDRLLHTGHLLNEFGGLLEVEVLDALSYFGDVF